MTEAASIVLSGSTPSFLSQYCCESKNTITLWVKIADEQGFDALRAKKQTGRPGSIAAYPLSKGGTIYLVLDNAPWHKKAIRLVQTEALPEYRDIREKMVLVSLPTYSPDLDPIEQVWRITRRDIPHNTYFPNVTVLESTLDDYITAKNPMICET